MQELEKDELMDVQGGGYGASVLIASGILFLIGVIDGIVRPLKCH